MATRVQESREMPIYALVAAKGGVKFSETKPENRSDFGPQMGRPVLDRTGLTGDYHLHMEFAPEAPAPKPGEAAASEPTGPSFMMALQGTVGAQAGDDQGAGGVSGDRPDRAAAGELGARWRER
jgi:hypothetical protein